MSPRRSKTNRLLPLLLLPLSLAALLASPGAAIAAEPIVVKMATLAPEGSTFHLILKEMGEKWKSASGDRVQLRIYPGSVAGDDADVVRKMRLGSLNAGLLTSVGVAAIDRSVYALQVPMMYASYGELDYVLGKMSGELEAALQAKGFIVLNWVDAGWIRFFSKTPVTRPDDLKPLKLFAWAGDSDAIEIWKGAGFHPVPLPSTEISTALQTGLVTALPITPQGAVIMQWYNHAKNMTDVKWTCLLGATLITKAAWEKIPAEMRPVLMAAARDAGRRLREDIRKGGDRDVEAMRKRGLTVISVDAAAEAQWRAAAEAAYPRIRGKVVPAEAFDEAKRLLLEYRKNPEAFGGRSAPAPPN